MMQSAESSRQSFGERGLEERADRGVRRSSGATGLRPFADPCRVAPESCGTGPARCRRYIALVACLIVCCSLAAGEPSQQSETGITHSFLATGGETYIMSEDNKITWRYPRSTREGWVLPNGNVLLAVSKDNKDYPGGAVVEVDKDGKVVFEFKGTQSEVNSVQQTGNDTFFLTEAGPKPRALEIDRSGKILLEFPLKCQTNNAHMETRMARKLANGNYLAPHLLDHAVREYKPDGTVVWEAKTPDTPKDSWPFTAIRLDNGHTHINCTHGNMAIEVDKEGKIVWQIENKDLPSPLLKDPCGAQRLPNGNTVICSYAAGGAGEVKLLEVTPEKKTVWTYKSGKGGGVHAVHILTTNGKPVEGRPLR